MSCSKPESISSHELKLQGFCRVCARRLTKGYKHTCSSSGSLLEPFGIVIATEKSAIHSPHPTIATTATALRKSWRKLGGLRVVLQHTSGQHIPRSVKCAQ